MLPVCMDFCKGRSLRVEPVAMENICHHLSGQRAGLSICTQARWRTSRRSRPRNRCLAIPHGIGSPVLSLKTLWRCNTWVKRSSIPLCMATPNIRFAKLTSAIFHHRPFLPPFCALIGSALSPCSLIPTANFGVALSKIRKPREGRI